MISVAEIKNITSIKEYNIFNSSEETLKAYVILEQYNIYLIHVEYSINDYPYKGKWSWGIKVFLSNNSQYFEIKDYELYHYGKKLISSDKLSDTTDHFLIYPNAFTSTIVLVNSNNDHCEGMAIITRLNEKILQGDKRSISEL